MAIATPSQPPAESKVDSVGAGIWKITLGNPEKFTPVRFQEESANAGALRELPGVEAPPFSTSDISFSTSDRGCVLTFPMENGEQIFGFGLQLRYFNQTGKRTICRTADNQNCETGDSHASIPFYVSTQGYGVFVDTLRYASFYCGNLKSAGNPLSASSADGGLATTTDELYKAREVAHKRMVIDVPAAKGVDVYVFAGPSLREAVQRYNLFSGGGVLPPLWGLGMWYRGYTKFAAADILNLAHDFRDRHLPFTVMGLEPGWHTHAYSCTYAWDHGRWPDPDAFIKEMKDLHYDLNLWEHAFVHPTSPIHVALEPYAGNYLVWGGLVPDFTVPEARKIFAEYHDQSLVKKGITGFKLDECDNQPAGASPWSWPELSAFPSGLDGEQMHSLLGVQYQRTLAAVFKGNNLRTYSKVRASHALAAPLPFVLYSDAYDHKDYVRAIATSGFGGLLWEPELRESTGIDDMFRRIETAIFSPMAVMDAWFLKLPPWRQIDRDKNNNNELLDNWQELEAKCRNLFNLRMQLIPYLYSAFADYRNTGLPPFRAVVMDYPQDPLTYKLDDEYLMGQSLLVAPLFAGQTQRTVYLPEGIWRSFWTGQTFEGGKKHDISAGLTEIPVFVKEGSLVPLAEPVEWVTPETVFDLVVQVFGKKCRPFTLYEDDGVSFNYEKGEQNRVTLSWKSRHGTLKRTGSFRSERYRIKEWREQGSS